MQLLIVHWQSPVIIGPLIGLNNIFRDIPLLIRETIQETCQNLVHAESGARNPLVQPALSYSGTAQRQADAEAGQRPRSTGGLVRRAQHTLSNNLPEGRHASFLLLHLLLLHRRIVQAVRVCLRRRRCIGAANVWDRFSPVLGGRAADVGHTRPSRANAAAIDCLAMCPVADASLAPLRSVKDRRRRGRRGQRRWDERRRGRRWKG